MTFDEKNLKPSHIQTIWMAACPDKLVPMFVALSPAISDNGIIRKRHGWFIKIVWIDEMTINYESTNI